MVNFFINLAAVVFKIELRNNFYKLSPFIAPFLFRKKKKVYFTVGLYFLDLLQIVITESLGGGSYPHQIHPNTFAVSYLLRKYSYF